MSIFSNRLRQLRLLAWIEGVSYLILLFIAMPMKYFAEQPQLVRVTGMIHGVLFVLFCINAVQAKMELNKSTRWLLKILLTAFIPFGMILADRWIETPKEAAVNS